MPTVEPLVSSFLAALLERLRSLEFPQFAFELKLVHFMVGETLTSIDDMLSDIEEKEIMDTKVECWLDDLEDLLYDMEDILVEIGTEVRRRKLMTESEASHSTVRKHVPDVFVDLNSNERMASEIKKTTARLKQLHKRGVELGLQKTTEVWRRAVGTQSLAIGVRPPSTSVPIAPAIYGREEDRAKILDMVLNVEASDGNFGVISIVGMAGIGKTTLARLVFNNHSVREIFNLRAWVNVGDGLDVLRISKAILKSVTSRPCVLDDLGQVQHLLKKSLAGRKFLFVLIEQVHQFSSELFRRSWEILCSAFMEGAPGSKIIVTTRHPFVALTDKHSLNLYQLDPLSDDACWFTFLEQADAIECGHLNVIRQKVVKKCRGCPLAARILGGLLRFKEMDEWEDILKSKLWKLYHGCEIPSALTVSYYYLPSHLKRCFAYCVVLPKHYEFEEKELVLLWMVEGLIQQSNDIMQMEELGGEYFHDLVSRSFFQKSVGDDSKFVMHNLIHDLAKIASGETSYSFDKAYLNSMNLSERVRYCSYSGDFYADGNNIELSSELKNLRTFLLVLADGHTRYVAYNHLSDLVSRYKKLRVLSFRNYDIIMVPDSIGNLTSLRYLNFSGTDIRTLPESTNMLFNLQVLLLRDCFCLVKLPSYMGNLISLRHLDITSANLIKEMPLGMENWEDLQTLSNFVVGKNVGSSLKALKNLKFLNGKLCISSLENVIESKGETFLIDKKGLEVLILEWGSLFDDSQNEAAENDVLDMLQPHKNLKELTIRCYGGINFPSWLGDPSFSNMVVLRLEYCEKCTSLPSLGLLGSLKELIIRGMKGLKSIGTEICGEGCSKPFQSLENLSFEDLDECEQWDPIDESEKVEVFSSLRELSITRCPKLIVNLPEHLPALEELVIHDCAQLMVSFSSFPMLYKAEVDRCRAIMCHGPTDSESPSNMSQISYLFKQVFQKVECFLLVDCEELIHFWQDEIRLEKPPQGLHSLIALRELSIENCPNLKAIPMVDFLSVLSILKIENCKALMSLPEALHYNNAHLQHLRIGGCHSLTFIFNGQLPSSLKRLDVKNCEELQYLFDGREIASAVSQSSCPAMRDGSQSFLEHLFVSQCPLLTCLSSRLQSLPVLKQLEISRCAKLVTLSSSGQLPETLQHLNIVDCPKLDSIAESFQSNMSLEFIKIRRCKKLKSIPGNLNSLSFLRDIYIWDCPSLVSFPEGGLLHSNLRLFSVDNCRELSALPDHMHRLNSLHGLELRQCPSITSIEEGLPISLTSLSIADVSIYRPLLEWGFNKLTSLKHLEIMGCVYAESFPHEETGMILPTSLTVLTIARFPKLKYLSSEGLHKLPTLEHLSISDCAALTSLPEPCLPSSLQQLYINNCPLLETRCERDTGEDWLKISHIPRIQIDGIFI